MTDRLAIALAVGSVAFGGMGQLKAADTLYWGGGVADLGGTSIDTLNAGAADVMGGTWDLSTRNWNLSRTDASNFQAWTDGSIAGFILGTNTFSPDVALAQDVTVSGMYVRLPGGSSANQRYDFVSNNATARTITLNPFSVIDPNWGDASDVLTFGGTGTPTSGRGAVLLAGSHGFTLKGNGGSSQVAIAGNNSALTGTVDILAGKLAVSGQYGNNIGGQLTGVNTFRVVGSNSELLAFDGSPTGTGTQGDLDRLGDSAEIVLKGAGRFSYRGNNGSTGSLETVNKLTIEGGGVLNITGNGTATSAATLSFAQGISRGANGKGLLVLDGAGLGTTNGLNIDVGTSLTANTVLPWAMVSAGPAQATKFTRFVTTDSGATSRKLAALASTAASADLSTWSTSYTSGNDNLHIDDVAPTGTLAGNVAVKTLAITARAADRTISLNGNQLSVESLGLLTDGRTINIGTNDALRGTLTSPGSDLNLIANRAGGAAQAGGSSIRAKITGNINLVTGGVGAISLATANDYTGSTYLGAQSNTIGATNAIPVNSPVYVIGGLDKLYSTGEYTLSYSDQWQTHSAMFTIDEGSVVGNGGNRTYNAPGFGFVFNGGLYNETSEAGDLNLLTDVKYEASARQNARFVTTSAIPEVIRLNNSATSVVRTFDIASSPYVAPGASNLSVSMAMINGPTASSAQVVKTGNGILEFTAANTYSGGTRISAGTIRLTGAGTLGTGSLILDGGTLDVSAMPSYSLPSTLTGSGTIDATGITITAANGVAPGNSTGLITVVGNLTMSGASNFEVNGPGLGTGYDAIDVSGLLTTGGSLNLAFAGEIGDGTYQLFAFGSKAGQFDSVTMSGFYTADLASDQDGTWHGAVGDTAFAFSETTGQLSVVVPEPTVLAMATVALGAFAIRRRRPM